MRLLKAVVLSAALLGAACLPAFAQTGASQKGGLELGGDLASRVDLLQTTGTSGDLSLAGISKLTLNFVNSNRDFAKVEGSVAVSLLQGAYAESYAAAVSQAYPTVGPALYTLVSTNGAAVNVNLRKLYLSIYTPIMDISAGRQIINFGEGTLFSPIDAFSTPELSSLDYERSGSDVIRIEVPFGMVSGLDAVSTVSDRVSGIRSAVKLYTNVADTDVSAVGIYRGDNREIIAGADFKGDLVVGLYGEAVQHFRFDPQSTWFEGMAGADYSVDNRLFLALEYYFNGDPSEPGSLSASEVAAAQRLFLNQNYLYLAVRYLLNDIMSVGADAVYDVSATAVLVTGQYSWNLVQNADLLVYTRYAYKDIRAGGDLTGPDLQYGVQVKVAF